MKLRRTISLLVLMVFILLQTSAQEATPPLNTPNYSKAKLFADLPDRMPLHIASFENLLDQPVGSQVRATISKDLFIVGSIVSRSNDSDPNVKSVVIKATNRQGSTFTFTRIKAPNGTYSYKGRMLSKSGGDALEIAKDGDEYVLHKKGLYDMMNE